jgi:S1-C subfamily serine protease
MTKLKKQHKIIIGSAGFLIIAFMIISGVCIYLIFTKLNTDYIELTGKIINTQTELEDLTNNLGSITSNITSLNKNVTNLNLDFSEIINNSIKSVVIIETTEGIGTGFFIYEGYIVTNTHVIVSGDSSKIKVITYDRKEYPASRGGDNPNWDISLLKIENVSYPSLKLGDSTKIRVGEKVIAVGNPLGLGISVTRGILSNIHQKIKNSPGEYIQTDTALNPGNSGGPLINSEGKVIGINNYKIFLFEGLGFALESNFIKDAVNEISSERNGYKLI